MLKDAANSLDRAGSNFAGILNCRMTYKVDRVMIHMSSISQWIPMKRTRTSSCILPLGTVRTAFTSMMVSEGGLSFRLGLPSLFGSHFLSCNFIKLDAQILMRTSTAFESLKYDFRNVSILTTHLPPNELKQWESNKQIWQTPRAPAHVSPPLSPPAPNVHRTCAECAFSTVDRLLIETKKIRQKGDTSPSSINSELRRLQGDARTYKNVNAEK